MKQLKLPHRQRGWVQFALAGASLASSLFGFSKSKSISKKADQANQLSAKNRLDEMYETVRRTKLQQEGVLSENRAKVFASNLQMGGSSASVQKTAKDEFARQLSWIEKSGKSEAEAIRLGGSINRASESLNRSTNLISGISSAAQTAGWLD